MIQSQINHLIKNAENYNDFQRNTYSKAYLNSYINKAMLLSTLLLISIRLHFFFSNVTIIFQITYLILIISTYNNTLIVKEMYCESE